MSRLMKTSVFHGNWVDVLENITLNISRVLLEQQILIGQN